MGVWVRQRPQLVKVFLAGRIPKIELDLLLVDDNLGQVVLEDGWDIILGKLIGRIGDQETL